MEKFVVIPRAGREIGWELGGCMACLANAGIRDYTARLDRLILFWVADHVSASALKALVDGGFNVVSGLGAHAPDSA